MCNSETTIQKTAAHIRRVGELMVQCSSELARRAVVHDESKWSDEEWPTFDRVTHQLAGMTYGSDEYKAALAEMKPALDHHYAANSHHPEHHDGELRRMSLLDLIEMLCDWKAAGERHDDGSMSRSIVMNRDRFGIGEQFEGVFWATAKELGWLDGDLSKEDVERALSEAGY